MIIVIYIQLNSLFINDTFTLTLNSPVAPNPPLDFRFETKKINTETYFKIFGLIRFILSALFISKILDIMKYREKKIFINFNLFLIFAVLFDIILQKFSGKDIFGFTGGMCHDLKYADVLDNLKTSTIFICQRFAGPFNQEFIAGSYILFVGTIIISYGFLNLKKKN